MTDQSLIFRTAVEADAKSVAEIYLASRKELISLVPLMYSDADVHQWIHQSLIPTGRVTVVEQNSKIIGMMATSKGWIDHLYLHPQVIRHGIGTQLVMRAKQELDSPIRLYTFQANTNATRFYEQQGFRVIEYSDGSRNEENCPDILYEWIG